MLRKFLKIIVFSFLLALVVTSPVLSAHNLENGINNLVSQIVKSMQEKSLTKIAIMEFIKLNGTVDNFGRYLSECLITNMFLTGKFKVVERRQLNKALEELKLSQTGLIDRESIKEIGKALGADALAIGSVTDLGDIVEVNARLVATETVEIFAVASTQFQKSVRVAYLMGIEVEEKEKGESVTIRAQEPDQEIEEALLGIRVRSITPELRNKYGLSENVEGVVVTEVSAGGPADGVGIEVGDGILEVNRKKVTNIADFNGAMQEVEPGEMILLRVRHGLWTMYMKILTRK